MGESRSVTAETITPLEYLDELFTFAFAIGMTFDQYWHDDPALINLFVKAEKVKQRKRNTEMWLQGAYIYNAIGALVPVINPFSKEHRAKPYLKQPIPISEEEKAEQERDKYERFVNYLMSKSKAEANKK